GRGRDGAGDAEAGVALHRQRGAVAAQVHGGRPGGAQGHVAAAGVVRRAGGGAVVGAGGGGRGRARRLGRPRCALDPLGGGQHPVGPPRPPRGLLRQGGGYGRGVRRHQGGQQRLEGSRVARPQATHFGPSHRFKLYALDQTLRLGNKVTKERLVDSMDGHVVGEAELVAMF
ncbi:unnamed protein product, partial [Musa textilis]